MALEEVGARLVAQGEAQYVAAMRRAKDATNGVTKSAEDAGKTAEKASKSGLAKFNDLFKQTTGISLTAAGAIGLGVVALKGLADYAGNAIGAASDLNETVSKSQVVFGDSADAVERMGNKAAEAMGMSKQEAIAAAATYGNLFTSMGMTKDMSAEMSMNLVQLASDMASFNNLPTADVLEKIRAGLTGETEPLKSLGININEAAIKQEALNLGLIKGKEALTPAIKAQATYSLVLKQSTNAQGDFARTSDGAANQQRILEAKNKDVAASIGKGLLPAYVGLLKIGNDVLTWIDNLINRNQKIVDQATVLKTKVKENSGSYKSYTDQLKEGLKAQGLTIDANGNLIETVVTLRDEYGYAIETQDKVIEANYAMTEATWDAIQMEKKWGTEADRGQAATMKLAGAFKDAGDDALGLKEAQDRVKASLNDLKTSISGDVGKSYTEFKQKQADLNKTIKETEDEIAKLSKLKVLSPAEITKVNDLWKHLELAKKKGGEFANMSETELKKAMIDLQTEINKITTGTFLTDEQKQQLKDLQSKLGEAKTEATNLGKEFELASKKMLFNVMLDKIDWDKLSIPDAQKLFENMSQVGVGLGIVDQQSADMMTAVNKIDWSKLQTPEEVKKAFQDIYDMVYNVPKNIDFTLGFEAFINGAPITYSDQLQTWVVKPMQDASKVPSKDTKFTNHLIINGMEFDSYQEYAKWLLASANAAAAMSDKTVTHTTNVVTKTWTEAQGGGGTNKKDQIRQFGGPVYAGSPYWVGERGPEPFIPSANGYMLSHAEAKAIFARMMQSVAAPAAAYRSQVVNNYNGSSYGPTNNWNLGVTTSQSPQVVQRSYAQMRLLSGA